MNENRVLLEMRELRGVQVENKEMAFAAKRSVSMVCAYCHIAEIPESILGVCVEIGLFLYDVEGYGEGDSLQGLTQMREGEVSFSFAHNQTIGEREILKRYREELDYVRNLKF